MAFRTRSHNTIERGHATLLARTKEPIQMHTFDPYQPYSAWGMHTTNPFGVPYSNPVYTNPVAVNPLLAGMTPWGHTHVGVPQQAANPLHQLQLAALASQGAIPQLLALSQLNPSLQNPIAAAIYQNAMQQNPLLAASLYNPLIAAAVQNQIQGAWGQFGQPVNPFSQVSHGQIGVASGQPGQSVAPQGQFIAGLAPQSFIGQPGLGQGWGQINPLIGQLTGRPF
ncbi:MAG: hypothetical protein C5B51_16765 [Terriglobia bacterium]|nr:MAG: hypothetical protein C5B51_16765 [Terriglobia bacterium]